MEPKFMTKAEFARHMGVGNSAVSNWIDRGIINSDALFGEGRKARISVRIAVYQVQSNRDVSQAMGNGLMTGAATGAKAEAVAPVKEAALDLSTPNTSEVETVAAANPKPKADVPKEPTVEDKLKQAKLRAQNMSNRRAAEDEALRKGMLISADDARDQMSRIAGMMLQIFEGAQIDVAAALSEKFSLPQRDVLHLMRSKFVEVRKTAMAKEDARILDLEKDKTVELELEG